MNDIRPLVVASTVAAVVTTVAYKIKIKKLRTAHQGEMRQQFDRVFKDAWDAGVQEGIHQEQKRTMYGLTKD